MQDFRRAEIHPVPDHRTVKHHFRYCASEDRAFRTGIGVRSPTAVISLFLLTCFSALAHGIPAIQLTTPLALQPATPPPQPCLSSLTTQAGVTICNQDSRYGLLSYTEGNLRETFPLFGFSCTGGAPFDLALTYNSFGASGADFRADTVSGFGWTHSYNLFIAEYRLDAYFSRGDGKVTKFRRRPDGSYVAAQGYFDTLIKLNSDTFVLTQKDGTEYLFQRLDNPPFLMPGPPFFITAITDRNGKQTTFTYQMNPALLTEIRDPYDRKVTFAYNAANKITAIQDPLGRLFQLGYDASSYELKSLRDPTGQELRYNYNTYHQLTERTDRAGTIFTYLYSKGTNDARPIAIKDNSTGDILRLSNPVNWGITLTNQTEIGYQPSTTTKIDGRSNQWSYQYDKHGYITGTTAPDGAVTRIVYDDEAAGEAGSGFLTLKVLQEIDANHRKTSYQYDAKGNRTKVTDALEHVTTYAYGDFNNVTMIVYPNGSITEYQYDAYGNRIQEVRDAHGLKLRTRWTYYDPDIPESGNPSGKRGLVKTMEVDNSPTVQITHYEYDSFGNQSKVIDPEGQVTQHTYDSVGNRTKTIDANNHVTSFAYDGLNRLVKVTDPLGFTTEYAYDGNGNRIEEKKQVTTTPVTYQVTRYEYDLRNRLIAEIRLNGGEQLVTRYTYDGNDNLIRVTDPKGQISTVEYDPQNRPSRAIDALGNATINRYDAAGNRTSVVDANQHYTYSEYDALNRQVLEIKKIGDTSPTPDGDDIVTRKFYDTGEEIPDCLNPQCSHPMPGSNSVSLTVDPEGKYTYFKYDALNRKVMTLKKVGDTNDVGNADDWTEILQYDAVGNVLRKTDANGNAMTYTFDLNNRRTSETNALGERTIHAYNAVGSEVRTQTPNGNLTAKRYDARNELMGVDDLVGKVAAYTYDGVGNRTTETDGNGNMTIYSYDLINRRTATTDPLGQTTIYRYDANNNLVQSFDREGRVTCYVYDAVNRRIRTAVKLGSSDCATVEIGDIWNATEYDKVGNVLRLITTKHTETPENCVSNVAGPGCEITRYSYDEVNRLAQKTYPDLTSEGFTYDKTGNTLTRRDPSGRITHYAYNDLYYLIERTYPATADTFTYDIAGRMLSAGRDGWVVTYLYDAANRVLRTTQNGTLVQYDYEIPNRTRELFYPGGRIITEQMDFRDRLSIINDNFSPSAIAQYTYDSGDRPITRVYRNGTRATVNYNANDWVINVVHTKADGSLIAGFGDDYDAEGNKIFENNQHDLGRSEAYQYDNFYRLSDHKVGTLVGTTVAAPVTQTQYDLDKLGNWDHKITDGVPQVREHDSVNAITRIDAVPIFNDNNGNLTQDEWFRYDYDEENRLVQVTRRSDSQVVGRYRYDALSRRVAKLLSSGQETRYVYDDARIIEEQNAANATLATYAYGNYIDELLNMERGGRSYYYHQNDLFSVAAVTDSTGGVVERYRYDAYGFPTVSDAAGRAVPVYDVNRPRSSIGNPFLFTGRQLDEESGMYFYRARYYDSLKGRFIQRDPSEYQDGMNLYQYAASNPIRLADPYGLKCGSGWTDKIVPDHPFGYHFESACAAHDRCYESCDAPVGLFSGSETLGARKDSCDITFLANMTGTCSQFLGTGDYGRCQDLSFTYYNAVASKGFTGFAIEFFGNFGGVTPGDAFINAQFKSGCVFLDQELQPLGGPPVVVVPIYPLPPPVVQPISYSVTLPAPVSTLPAPIAPVYSTPAFALQTQTGAGGLPQQLPSQVVQTGPAQTVPNVSVGGQRIQTTGTPTRRVAGAPTTSREAGGAGNLLFVASIWLAGWLCGKSLLKRNGRRA